MGFFFPLYTVFSLNRYDLALGQGSFSLYEVGNCLSYSISFLTILMI